MNSTPDQKIENNTNICAVSGEGDVKMMNRNSKIIYSYPNDVVDNHNNNQTIVYSQKPPQLRQSKQFITYSSTANSLRRLSLNNKAPSSSSSASSSSPNHYSNSSNFSSEQNEIYNRMPANNCISNADNAKIYQSTKRAELKNSLNNNKNYLNCINKLIDENNEIYVSNQPIYEKSNQKMHYQHDDTNLIKIANYQEINPKETMASVNRVGSFRKRNDNKLNELLRAQANQNKPIPPNRTSSLQYRLNPKSMSLLIKGRNLNEMSPQQEKTIDRNSIYSTFSLRNSARLSSFNIGSSLNQQDSNLLRKNEIFKIESCYKSIGSSVYAASCFADFYSTNLQCLIKLLDWTHQVRGVPVWVFNTGLNPKRPKGNLDQKSASK